MVTIKILLENFKTINVIELLENLKEPHKNKLAIAQFLFEGYQY